MVGAMAAKTNKQTPPPPKKTVKSHVNLTKLDGIQINSGERKPSFSQTQ